jgi:hypothetical protein
LLAVERLTRRPGGPGVGPVIDWTTEPTYAAAHFARRLAVETDVSDVHAALESGSPGFVLLDSRSTEAREQGHVLGAVHLPGRDIGARAARELDRSVPVVSHHTVALWATPRPRALRAPLVRIPGGSREGVRRPDVDPLTAPTGASCGS